jgi:hypothetical protein
LCLFPVIFSPFLRGIHRAARPASFRQKPFDREQFETPLCRGPGIRHLELPHRIHNDLGDNKPRVVLVVGVALFSLPPFRGTP